MIDIPLIEIPKASKIIEDLKKSISKHTVIINKRYFFIFVCGGSMTNPQNLRSKFLNSSSQLQDEFRIVLSETSLQFSSALKRQGFQNIALFEENIAHLADCIMVFPESPGSFAEVGYFSALEKIKDKVLVINLLKHQEESFLNLGPLDLIEQTSHFKPRLHLSNDNPENEFALITERLNRMNHFHKVPQRLKIGDRKFKTLGRYEQVMLCLKIIELFPGTSPEDFKEIMSQIFGFVDYLEIDNHLAILEDSDFLETSSSHGWKHLRPISPDASGIHFPKAKDDQIKLLTSELFSKRYRV